MTTSPSYERPTPNTLELANLATAITKPHTPALYHGTCRSYTAPHPYTRRQPAPRAWQNLRVRGAPPARGPSQYILFTMMLSEKYGVQVCGCADRPATVLTYLHTYGVVVR